MDVKKLGIENMSEKQLFSKLTQLTSAISDIVDYATEEHGFKAAAAVVVGVMDYDENGKECGTFVNDMTIGHAPIIFELAQTTKVAKHLSEARIDEDDFKELERALKSFFEAREED